MRYLFLIFLLISSATRADSFCDQGILETIMMAYPATTITNNGNNALLNGDINKQVDLSYVGESKCKVWPAFPNLAIVILKTNFSIDPEFPSEVGANLEIFLVSLNDKKIINHYIDKGILSSDAIKVVSLEIDTARYQLNTSTLAFGIRIDREGSSRVNPYHVETINLYTYENNAIKKVLDNMIVRTFYGENNGSCVGDYGKTKSILIIDNKKLSSNYFSIIVKQNETSFETVLDGDECVDIEKSKSTNIYTLKYGSTSYKVPSEILY